MRKPWPHGGVRVIGDTKLPEGFVPPSASLTPPTTNHGTYNQYRAGCRCPLCKRAAAEYARERYRQRAANLDLLDAAGMITHGTTNTYFNYGCRCQPCTEAMRSHERARRQRKAKERPTP